MNTAVNPDSLIRALLERYAAISTYRDRGFVSRACRDGSAPTPIPFSTLFRRPSGFRFSFATAHPYPPLAHMVSQHCVGADSIGAYSWTKHHEEPSSFEVHDDLSSAIAGATGISRGAAHTIAGLLLPDIGGLMLGHIPGWRFLRREAVEGTECVGLSASHRGWEQSLWIHEMTMTLRKVVRSGGVTPETIEVRREIEIDGPVTDDELERPAAA